MSNERTRFTPILMRFTTLSFDEIKHFRVLYIFLKVMENLEKNKFMIDSDLMIIYQYIKLVDLI